MTRVSSRATPFFKWGFLLLWLAVLANYLHAELLQRQDRFDGLVALAVFTPLLAWNFFRGPWRWADLVTADANTLVVRRNRKERRIKLADVLNVSYGRYNVSPLATICLRGERGFGDEFHFLIGGASWNPFARPVRIEELMLSIDNAKRGVGR